MSSFYGGFCNIRVRGSRCRGCGGFCDIRGSCSWFCSTGCYIFVLSSFGWNIRGGGAKVSKSLNVEVGINVEGGIFLEKTST